MKKFRTIIQFLLLGPLLTSSLLLFSFPASVEAAEPHVCFDETKSNGGLLKPTTISGESPCPNTHTEITSLNIDTTGTVSYPGVCVGLFGPGRYYLGDARAVDNSSPNPLSCEQGETYVAYSTIQQYVPTTPPIIANNNGNNNANSNTGNSNTKVNSNTKSPTNSKVSTPAQGKCTDANFHQAGPLCIPNNPFNNSNSILGEQSLGGLAAKVVKILLFFAGIVAVIMIIIGGYQIMTAAGNETQAKNGRKTLTNALIGLVIIILSYTIVTALVNFITKG